MHCTTFPNHAGAFMDASLTRPVLHCTGFLTGDLHEWCRHHDLQCIALHRTTYPKHAGDLHVARM